MYTFILQSGVAGCRRPGKPGAEGCKPFDRQFIPWQSDARLNLDPAPVWSPSRGQQPLRG
jgi:hypothetical protein